MTSNPHAGRLVDPKELVNLPRLVTAYFAGEPDPGIASQRVAFGTSGHRGSAFHNSFNEAHVLAIAQAICTYRQHHGIDGPLFLGMDTHALSEPAFASVLEVLAANNVDTFIDKDLHYTPTPVVSHAILSYNRGRTSGLADGVLLTPSHNPPEDGGLKYNPPTGGPADATTTERIERLANAILQNGLRDVRRIPYSRARTSACIRTHDYVSGYVSDLVNMADLPAVRSSGASIGIDPLGGASTYFWAPIIDHYGLAATITNDTIDATFRFVPADWDGRIRMDCSSPYAMAHLIGLREKFDIAFANDADADRHGIVTRSAGLLKPNDFLAAAISYLIANRPRWSPNCAIGKTIVSSGIIDRVASRYGHALLEVPVGFKWFVDGLRDGSVAFAGEESAGATFLRMDGGVWTTDKDGIVLGLLAAEIMARTGRDPGELYHTLTAELGTPFYERIDVAATSAQKSAFKSAATERLGLKELGGEPVLKVLTTAPGNGQSFGGFKIIAQSGWFAARPSGTEDVYKLYAESFRSEDHLRNIQSDAKSVIAKLFEDAPQVSRTV